MSLGGSEILVIAVLALMLLGPDKLPGALRMFGRVMGEVRKYQDLAKNEIDKAMAAAESAVNDIPVEDSSDDLSQSEEKIEADTEKASKKKPALSDSASQSEIAPILDEDEQ